MTEQDTVTMLGPASTLLSLSLVITARADNNFLTGEGFVIFKVMICRTVHTLRLSIKNRDYFR